VTTVRAIRTETALNAVRLAPNARERTPIPTRAIAEVRLEGLGLAARLGAFIDASL
jgi:hypothetical protein